MHAITFSTFGAARDVLELRNLQTPEPQAGEVCIHLAFSGVNPSDVKARAGTRLGVTKPPFPTIIPHSDGSGVIEAVGAGVDTNALVSGSGSGTANGSAPLARPPAISPCPPIRRRPCLMRSVFKPGQALVF